MITGKAKKHPENYVSGENFNTLKFSALYGLNAGGKSNFVDAIGFSQAVILNDLDKVITKDRYNKNHLENKYKVTDFEYEILIEKRIYSYGFSANLAKKTIYKEYLLDITDENNEISIFTRDFENEQNVINVNYEILEVDAGTINRINVYKEDLLNSSLFLNTLNNTSKKSIKSANERTIIIEKVYNWFEDSLEVISPSGTTKSFNLTYLNEKYLKALGKYLNAFDTGVKEVRFEKSSEEALGLPPRIREKIFEKLSMDSSLEESNSEDKPKGALMRTPENIFKLYKNEESIDIEEIRFVHNSDNITYSLEEESDGTKRIIDIFSILLEEENKVYIIDELDRSLHPNLTFNFIKKFLYNNSNNQLIVTTHEDRLLDLNLLRRDQIWFIDRNEEGNSEIYSLEDFKERFDKNILKQYLDGRYGSVPKFNFIFEE